jgi:hypothetical protein
MWVIITAYLPIVRIGIYLGHWIEPMSIHNHMNAAEPLEHPPPIFPSENQTPAGQNRGDGMCGAKTRNGSPCKRSPVTGRTRCKLHGGLSPCGAAHYRFRDGRRSKYLKHLSRHLGRAYQTALTDPKLLSLRDEVALLDARACQLLELLKTATGEEHDLIWAELQKCVMRKSRVVEAELRRLREAQTTLNAEQAATLVSALITAVRETITDPGMLRALQAKLVLLLPPVEG